jgi:thiamine kinase-like enzyme
MSERPDAATARRALARLGGMARDAERVVLAPLPGGTHARSWLVTYRDGTQHVLRLAAPGSPALLDVVTEARAMLAAAEAGLPPAVVALDAEWGTLLTEYRLGTPWKTQQAREPANIERAAALLRRLHAVRVELPVFAAERIARGYLERLAAGAVPAANEPRARQWADELVMRARHHDRRYAPTAFCHHDLFAANIVDDGELALVDFEYAVRATPLLDLASYAAMNGLNRDECCALLAAYSGAAPTSAEQDELAAVVRLVRLMAWFWALLGAAQTAAPAAYAGYLTTLAAEIEQE